MRENSSDLVRLYQRGLAGSYSIKSLVDSETLAERQQAIIEALDWHGPVYEIAAINGTETDRLAGDLMTAIEHLNEQEASDPELAQMELDVPEQMQFEARERIELCALA